MKFIHQLWRVFLFLIVLCSTQMIVAQEQEGNREVKERTENQDRERSEAGETNSRDEQPEREDRSESDERGQREEQPERDARSDKEDKSQSPGREVKEVKGARSDISRERRGARPEIERPSGAGRPAGAGRPEGVGRPDRPGRR
ncbi:hypothetical protein [Alkalitalea saponilacus]|nr:hypothetical protein [Alkalitalea saponilacus]